MESPASMGRAIIRGACLAAAVAGAVACSDTQSATAPSATPGAASRVTAAGVLATSNGGFVGPVVGAVYTSTNATTGNAVVAFARDAHGALRSIGRFTTGGTGIGGTVDPLSSQFALILDPGHAHLYVVNAGSNDISVFAVHPDGTLEWRQRTSSRGTLPVSVALRGDRLYVLNAGDATVAAFTVHEDGTLSDLVKGARGLPSGAGGPSTVGVAEDGRVLVVTERTANRIDLFPLDDDGRPGEGRGYPSHGATPFGFDVGRDGLVVVSEAGPNAISSYDVRGGMLDLRDGSVPTDQSATCWVRLTRDGRLAFSVNSGSASLTGFDVGRNGELTRLTLNGQTGVLPAGSAPLDLDVTDDDHFVFTIEAGSGGIGGFSIGQDGGLTRLAGATGAVAASSGAEGLAAF